MPVARQVDQITMARLICGAPPTNRPLTLQDKLFFSSFYWLAIA